MLLKILQQNTNPYFCYIAEEDFTSLNIVNKWILVVGYIYPSSYTGTISSLDESGYYVSGSDKTKKVIGSAMDFKWSPTATLSNFGFRCFLHYGTDTTNLQSYCYPRIDMCDGTEPSISDLLNGYDSINYDRYLRDGNTNNFKVKH